MYKNKSLNLGIGGLWLLMSVEAFAQNAGSIGSPVSNTPKIFNDRPSVLRDSDINNVFGLLNDFYPAIEVSLSRRDNIFRVNSVSEAALENDTVLEIKPSLAYRTNLGRHKFYAAYSGVYRSYFENDDENASSNNLNAQLSLDISNSLDVNLFAETGKSFEDRGVSGSRPFNRLLVGRDIGPDEYKYSSYGADIIYGKRTSPLNAVLGLERYNLSYRNNSQGLEDTFSDRDRSSDTLHFDLSYQIGSRTAVFGRLEKVNIDYDQTGSDLSSEVDRYLIGLRWSQGSRLSGVFGVGSTKKDFDDPLRKDYSGSNYFANIDYRIRPFSNIALSASRSVEESADINSNYYISEYLGVGWNHSLSDRFSFSVYAKHIDDELDTGRNDKYKDYGVTLSYDWRRWMQFGVYAGNIERNSNRDLFDYDEAYYGIRLRSDLRSLLKGRSKVAEPDASFDYPETQSQDR